MGATNTGRRPTPTLDHTPCYHSFNPPQIGTEPHQLKTYKVKRDEETNKKKDDTIVAEFIV